MKNTTTYVGIIGFLLIASFFTVQAFAEEQCITTQTLPKYKVVGGIIKLIQSEPVTKCFEKDDTPTRPGWEWTPDNAIIDFKYKSMNVFVLDDEFNIVINVFDTRCHTGELVKTCTRHVPYSNIQVSIFNTETGELINDLHSRTNKLGEGVAFIHIDAPEYQEHQFYDVIVKVTHGDQEVIHNYHFWTVARGDRV